MKLLIEPTGHIRAVYDEELDWRALGAVSIARGSHVEPTPGGEWTADLSPVAGPVLGPFRLRSEALVAERQWLQREWLTSRRF